MNSVLLVSSDSSQRSALKEVLAENDFLVLETPNVEWLKEILKRHSLDLVLLDVRSADQFDLAQILQIRHHSDVPLLILCGDCEPSWKAQAFDHGADGFIKRPVNFDEFLAGVKANIRRDRLRTSGTQGQIESKQDSEPTVFGRWTINTAQSQIFDTDNLSAGLTVREFRLLETLVKNAGTVMNRRDLCEAMQEENYVPQPRAIDIKIARIRKKIGDVGDHPEFIKTVRGVGYMFEKYKISNIAGLRSGAFQRAADLR